MHRVPDSEAFEIVERAYPTLPNADQYHMIQAVACLRGCFYFRLKEA